MNEKLMSVIIPVFNAEKYLKDCITSILNQTYKNLEIILINDKSSDRSGQIIDFYANKDKRIKVLHKQQNEGVSMARNSGLLMATGEYVTFVDADDYLDDNFSTIVKKLDKNDIIIVPYFEVTSQKTKLIIPNKNMLNKPINDFENYRIMNGLYNSACFKIFRRNFLVKNNMVFDKELIIAEDLKFSIESILSTRKIQFLGIPYYHYRRNDCSVMSNVSFRKINDTLNVCQYGISLCQAIKDKSKLKFLKKIISENLLSVICCAGKYSPEQNKLLLNKLISVKKFFTYGSTTAKKLVILSIKVFGIRMTAKLLKLK